MNNLSATQPMSKIVSTLLSTDDGDNGRDGCNGRCFHSCRCCIATKEEHERKNQHTQSKLVHKTKAVDENVKLMEAIHDLRLATIRGDLQAVKDALDKGLTVNQPLKGGWTALMYACSLGHPLIVEFLLQQGANPNFHKELFTPLMATCASTQEHEDRLVQCVDLLLRYKANVNITERHHISALMFAAKEGHAKIVAQLLGENCNCEIDAQDSQGWTALFWAVNKGRANVVEILVRKGAKVDILDRRSHTAIDLAQNKRLDQIVEILKRKQPIIEYSQSEQVNYDSSGFKQKYEFEKNADSMLQVILEELSATAVNNNGRCGNRYKTLFNGMEFENNLELLKPHEEMILKVASSLNGCFQNSLLTNKFPKNSKYKYKSVETSWKNIPYRTPTQGSKALGSHLCLVKEIDRAVKEGVVVVMVELLLLPPPMHKKSSHRSLSKRLELYSMKSVNALASMTTCTSREQQTSYS
ncbi:Asz1p [Homalodisca vitripennis]|nr:Asz1p [Homalodisca vitripennis]